MGVNLDLLEQLMNTDSAEPYFLHLDEKDFELREVTIKNSPTPVNSPTTRGGVYFSDKFANKIKGTIKDLSIVPLLTKTMLGPNTDFGEIKITTTLESNKEKKDITIFANLTNSVQGPSKIELNMIIVNLE
jgi:hypothetical protein